MTDLQTFIISLIGSFPAGLEFLLPIFSFVVLIIGLILVSIIFALLIKVVRG